MTTAAGGTQERDGGPDGRSGTVWVVNRDLGEVTIFDARSGRPLATRPTGLGAHEVAISNEVDKAYITNENEHGLDPVHAYARRLEDPTRSTTTPRRAQS
jgi:hypothetical protein